MNDCFSWGGSHVHGTHPGERISRRHLSPSLDDVVFITRSELTIRKRIGKGSFGTVFKGRLYDQDVAVKILNSSVPNCVSRVSLLVESVERSQEQISNKRKKELDDMVAALEREVRVLKSVCFTTIVQFYGVCLEPAAIITEYCSQQSLFDFIGLARTEREYGDRLTWPKRLQIACDAACGMHYLHYRDCSPVLHRDLKSPNLLLDEHLNCKICDFNTARFIDSQHITTNSIAANNPHWLAPEVLQGKPSTKASDVYPFGTILWELMTWMFPYETNGRPRIPAAVIFGTVFKNERPVIPANEDLIGGRCPVYDDYCALIQRCWSAVPDERPMFPEIVEIIQGFLTRVGSFRLPHRSSAPTPSSEQVAPPRSAQSQPLGGGELKRSNQFDKQTVARIVAEHFPQIAVTGASDEHSKYTTGTLKGASPFARMSESNGTELDHRRPSGTESAGNPQNNLSGIPVHVAASRESVNNRLASISRDSVPSNQSLVQHRWDRIRKAVRFICAQRFRSKLRRMTPDLNQTRSLKISGSQLSSPASLSGESLTAIEEESDVTCARNNPATSNGTGWSKARDALLPSATPNVLLDKLTDHLIARNSWRASSDSSGSHMCSGNIAAHGWDVVKNNFLETDLKGYPRTPAVWEATLKVLLAHDSGNSLTHTQRRHLHGKSSNPESKRCLERTKEWLTKDDPFIRKNRGSLMSVMTCADALKDSDDESIIMGLRGETSPDEKSH